MKEKESRTIRGNEQEKRAHAMSLASIEEVSSFFISHHVIYKIVDIVL